VSIIIIVIITIIVIATIIVIITIIVTIIYITRYDKIIDTAIKEINKMIFAEIQQEILDFDNLWMNPNNNVIDIITSSLKSSFEVSIIIVIVIVIVINMIIIFR
jgi:hypothetical protein